MSRCMEAALEPLEQRICMSVSYGTPTDYTAAGLADFVAAADFDKDGKQDLVVSSYDASSLTVFFGDGAGGFSNYLDIALTSAPDFVTAADLNADGKMDLVTASYDDNAVSVLLGNGDGTFATPVNYAAGTGGRAVALGDFTGDGKLDIAIAKSFDTNLTILKNNGNGTFMAPVNSSLGFAPTDLATGDFNGDGKLDLAAASFFTDQVTILLGNGNGTFATAVKYSTGAGPAAVAVADINADGKLDVLTADLLDNTVSVLRGNGNGTLNAHVDLTAGDGPTCVAAADLDCDGNVDIVAVNGTDDTLSIFWGTGSGNFSSAESHATSSSPRSIVVGSFDGLGGLDLAVANQGIGTVSVFMGGGIATPNTQAVPGGPYSVNEGASISLSGAGSTGTGLTYTWDLDGDGIYGETGAGATRGGETGVSPTFSAVGLDGPGTFVVSLRVRDVNGVTDTASATITIVNLAPTLTLSGGTSVAEGASYTLSLAASDPGNDTISNWVINWGDGNTQTVLGNPSTVAHVFADSGTYTVSATATDEDGTYNAGNSKVISVSNVAPSLTLSGGISIAEGSTYTLSLASSDQGTDTITQWLINWGDGNSQTVLGNPSTVPHVFADNGTYTVSATATDEDGTYNAGNTKVVSVSNVAPSLTLSGGNSVAEGSSYTLSLAASDPGTDTISKWTINWGDGNTQTVLGNPSTTSHVFADNGTYTISATATDEDGTYNAGNSMVVSVSNVAPSLTLSGGTSVAEGSTYTLSLASSDPGTDTISKWVITWGDGNTQTILSNPSTVAHVFADNGTYTVSATATDEDGSYIAGNTKAVSVSNVAPSLTLSGGSSVAEGSSYTLSLASTDPGADTISQWVINWGDGNTQTVLGHPSTTSHVFADNGTYTISASAADEDGTYNAGNTKVVSVSNVAPSLTLSGASSAAEGSSYTLSLTAIDPGADTISKWTVNWGDGNTQTVVGNPSTTSHVFADNGTYTISATATDEDGTYNAGNSKVLSVSNVAPSLTLSGGTSSAEGSSYILTLASSDPGTDTISRWVINWGDGSSQTVQGNPSTVSHIFADNGAYTISATATDEDGTYSAGNSKVVSVSNVAPALTLSGASSVDEGSSYTLSLASSDPGTDTISQWVINWGDGSSQNVQGSPSTVPHVFADNGTYTVSATATDEDATYNAGNSKVVTVNNVAPSLTLSGGDAVDSGATYTLTLNVSDPGTDSVSGWTINWGDGVVDSINGSPSNATHVYDTNSTTVTISATATDEDGTYNASPKLLSVTGAAPQANAGGPYSVNEEGTLALDGSNSLGLGTLTYEWDLDGDGIFGEIGSGAVRGNETGITPTFSAAGLNGPATYQVSLRVTNQDGQSSTSTATITIVDVAPVLSISGASTATAGTSYTLKLAAAYVGSDPISKWMINWGDGTSQTFTGSPSSVTKIYATAGGRTISASAADANGIYKANSMSISVVAPTAPDAAGNSSTAALDLGTLKAGTIKALNETVGPSDRNDYYKFTITTTLTIAATLTNLTDNADLMLLNSSGTRIAYSKHTGTTSEKFTTTLKAGSYYVRVLSTGTTNTPYRLRLAASTPVKNVKSLPPLIESAPYLGSFAAGTIKTISDSLSVSNSDDYFRFALSSSEYLYLKLSNLSVDANLELLDSAGTVITSSARSGTSDEPLQIDLSAGTYYVHVLLAQATSTGYRLRFATS